MRIGNYEELKILKDGKPIVVISEFYHKNYLDIKKTIHRNLKYLGGPAKNYSQQKM
jgi:hypothetical protein